MKAIIFISASIFGLFLSNSAFAQTDKASQLDIETKKEQQLDLLVPQKEPAYVIGDDGQKVYFLVDPISTSIGNQPANNSSKVSDEKKNSGLKPKGEK